MNWCICVDSGAVCRHSAWGLSEDPLADIALVANLSRLILRIVFNSRGKNKDRSGVDKEGPLYGACSYLPSARDTDLSFYV
jgi:hypothetical protein